MIDYSTDWIITLANTDTKETEIFKFYGTEDEVKQLLVNIVKEDRDNIPDEYEARTENILDVEKSNPGLFCAYGKYKDFHIIYIAMEWPRIRYI